MSWIFSELCLTFLAHAIHHSAGTCSKCHMISNVLHSNGLIIVLRGMHPNTLALIPSASPAKLCGSLILSLKTSKGKPNQRLPPAWKLHRGVLSPASVTRPPSLQHRRQVWCGLLRQRIDFKRRIDLLASSRYLSQHVCHRDHLLSFRLSKLYTSVQVRHAS